MESFYELEENELNEVNGGYSPWVVYIGVLAVLEGCNVVYNFGKGVYNGYHGK